MAVAAQETVEGLGPLVERQDECFIFWSSVRSTAGLPPRRAKAWTGSIRCRRGLGLLCLGEKPAERHEFRHGSISAEAMIPVLNPAPRIGRRRGGFKGPRRPMPDSAYPETSRLTRRPEVPIGFVTGVPAGCQDCGPGCCPPCWTEIRESAGKVMVMTSVWALDWGRLATAGGEIGVRARVRRTDSEDFAEDLAGQSGKDTHVLRVRRETELLTEEVDRQLEQDQPKSIPLLARIARSPWRIRPPLAWGIAGSYPATPGITGGIGVETRQERERRHRQARRRRRGLRGGHRRRRIVHRGDGRRGGVVVNRNGVRRHHRAT